MPETNKITNLIILASMVFLLIFLIYAYLQHGNVVLFILSSLVVMAYFVSSSIGRGILSVSEKSKKIANTVQTLDLLAAIMVIVLNYQFIS